MNNTISHIEIPAPDLAKVPLVSYNLLLLTVLLGFITCNSRRQTISITEYEPFSTATLELQVRDKPRDTLYAELRTITNIPKDLSQSELLTVATSGTYYLQLEIDRPNQSSLSINDSIFNIVTIPNDTIFVILTTSNRKVELQFSGRHKEMNEYLLAKQNKLRYSDLRIPLNTWITSKAKYSQVIFKTDSLVKNELDFLEQYLVSHELPDWFIRYERAEIEYLGAGFKLIMPVNNRIFTVFKDSVPSNYYDFLLDVEINNENAILSWKYYWFLDDFFLRDLPYEEFNQLAGYSRLSKIYGFIQHKAKNKLSGRVKDIYDRYMFSALAQVTSDSLKIDSLAKQFEIQEFHKFTKLFGSKVRDKKEFKNLQIGDQVIEFFVANEIDNLVSIRGFSNKFVHINFWATWCGPCLKHIPEHNKLIDEYSDNNKVVFLNICLYSKKDNWKKTIKKTRLKGINLFAEGTWGEKLTSEFNLKGVPTYVLLDNNNRLFENNTGTPIIKSKINKLLEINATQ